MVKDILKTELNYIYKMSFLQSNIEEKSTVEVAVRIRPMNNRELNTDSITNIKNTSIYIKNPDDNKKKSFTYDYAYGSDTTQEDIYKDIGYKVVNNAFKGYNSCIFAYGQTGCFAAGTPIMMFDRSIKNVEDIKLNDKIMGDDYNIRNVKKLFYGQQTMYKIEPIQELNSIKNIPSYTVNKDHIMVLVKNLPSISLQYNIDISPKNLINEIIYHRKHGYEIDNNEIVELPISALSIDRMYYGVYRDERDYFLYCFKITQLDVSDYYGFMLDANHRFLHASGIVLRNSGKSHTMSGDNNDPGLIPRICEELFNTQNNSFFMTDDVIVNYKIELSYLEIYSENVRDLLSIENKSLKVRQHPELGPYVEGLSQILVENYNNAKKLIDQGTKERIIASTLMNARSSRSHSILTLYFTQLITNPQFGKTREIVSKINLVDLAGSEKVDASGVTGINFKEAININKSLSTLGLVISKLALLSSQPSKSQPSNSQPSNSHSSKSQLNKLLHESRSTQNYKNITYNNNSLKRLKNKDIPALKKVKSVDNISPNSCSNVSPSSSLNISPRSCSNVSPRYKLTKSVKPSPRIIEEKITEHVPFRDSVLTWILKESLGGNSKTYMVATVSPSAINYNESLSTLRYAFNAKQIVNNVKVNEDPNDKLIRVLTAEVETLKKQLLLKGSDGHTSNDELKKLKEELLQREDLLKEKDKTWEQKLNESKRINNEIQEQFMQKIKSMDDEKLEISKQLELLKSELNGKDVIDKKVFEEELAKKQAEFEKGRIMDTAVSLHEYYEKKIDKIKTDYEEKLYNKSTQENTQLLNEIKNLQETNSKLKEEITRLNTNLQLQLKQYTNDKNSLLRQIQQLHSKINTMELEITEYTKINTLLNNQIQELKKLQM